MSEFLGNPKPTCSRPGRGKGKPHSACSPYQFCQARKYKNPERKTHPSNSFIPSFFMSRSTVGGFGGMSLPLPVEIVATDIPLDDNGGAGRDFGWWVGKTKNASCSELRGLPLPGEGGSYI